MMGIADALLPKKVATDFFSTFEMKAFVAIQTSNGSNFYLEDKITAGNVLEVAIRKVKEGYEQDFDRLRNGFFGRIQEQQGYLFDQEFLDLQNGDKVVLIGWNSIEAFQKAAEKLQSYTEMGNFFAALDVKAYQALMLHSV